MKNMKFGEKVLVNKASGLRGRVVNNDAAAEARLNRMHAGLKHVSLQRVVNFIETANDNLKVVELDGYGQVFADKDGKPVHYYKINRHWIKDAKAKDGGRLLGEYYTKMPVKPMGRMGSSPRATLAMDMDITKKVMACIMGQPVAEYKDPRYAAEYIDGITIAAGPASVAYFAPQFYEKGREYPYYAPAIDKQSGRLHPKFQAFNGLGETIFKNYRPADDETIAFQLWSRSIIAKYRD